MSSPVVALPPLVQQVPCQVEEPGGKPHLLRVPFLQSLPRGPVEGFPQVRAYPFKHLFYGQGGACHSPGTFQDVPISLNEKFIEGEPPSGLLLYDPVA